MVLVTVGTHEQPFDRLVRAMDAIAGGGGVGEGTFVQLGYGTYLPEHCAWERFVPHDRMARLMAEADVVVTHGGPTSIFEAVSAGKVPVVVPRLRRFGEHVNDHQLDFVRHAEERGMGVVAVYDVADLARAIERARAATASPRPSNNAAFCERLLGLIEGLDA